MPVGKSAVRTALLLLLTTYVFSSRWGEYETYELIFGTEHPHDVTKSLQKC